MPSPLRLRNDRAAAAPGTEPVTEWKRGKRLAAALNALIICAVLLPIAENWRGQPRDSFPLSYYPMFSLKRAKRARVNYLVGIDARGERRPLPYTCAGTGGLNQVRRQINRAVREGRAADVCAQVAASSALRSPGPFTDVVEVRLVSGEYHLAKYFTSDKAPVSERIHAAQRVRRGGT